MTVPDYCSPLHVSPHVHSSQALHSHLFINHLMVQPHKNHKFAIESCFSQTYRRPRMASLLDYFVFPSSAHIIIYGPYTTFMNLLSMENVTLRSAMAKNCFPSTFFGLFQLNQKAKLSFLVNGMIYHDSVQILEACYYES